MNTHDEQQFLENAPQLLEDVREELRLYVIGSCLLNGYSNAAVEGKLKDCDILNRLDAAIGKLKS